MLSDPTIIGISPGSRYIGVAVLRGCELRDWRIKVIRAKTDEERMSNLRSVFSKLLIWYRPNLVAMKSVHKSRGSNALRTVVESVRGITREHVLPLEEYSLETIKQKVGQRVSKSKRQMSIELATTYPSLQKLLKDLVDSKTYYQIRVFEAVAVARACLIGRNEPNL